MQYKRCSTGGYTRSSSGGAVGAATTCACGPWYKARKCSDDTVVDIGFTSSDTNLLWTNYGTWGSIFGPIRTTFKYGGVCYYMYSTDFPVSSPPSTVLSYGSVPTYKCCSECNTGAACCTGCFSGAPVPHTLQAVASGITFCPVGCYAALDSSGFDINITATGDNNGTYCLHLLDIQIGFCVYVAPLPNPITYTHYRFGSFTGTCIGGTLSTHVVDMLYVGISAGFGGGGPGEVGVFMAESALLPYIFSGFQYPGHFNDGAAFYSRHKNMLTQPCTDFVASNSIPTGCGEQSENIFTFDTGTLLTQVGYGGSIAVVLDGC